MLTRRSVRAKVLETIYSEFRKGEREFSVYTSKNIISEIEQTKTLYFWQLSLLVFIRKYASEKLELGSQRKYTKQENESKYKIFEDNHFLKWLDQNEELDKFIRKNNQLSWEYHREYLSELMSEILNSNLLEKALSSNEKSGFQERKLILSIHRKFIAGNAYLHEVYEEQNLHFVSINLQIANSLTQKTIESSKEKLEIYEVFEKSEDKEFALDLYKNTINNLKEISEHIVPNLVGWDKDRIAKMDDVILKLAVSEFLYFPSIPFKVTMNEYIELTQDYSGVKNKVFVNGILDKIQKDLAKRSVPLKTGRGLVG